MQVKNCDKDFHDKIAKLVCNHFNNLPKKGKPLSNEWTTLAAIVQSTEKCTSNPQNFTVVSSATGTKCIGKKELSPSGDVINDSHAEVLTRRSFLLYLLDQLQLCTTVSSYNSIFHKNKAPVSPLSITQYSLTEGVEFHLFVSQQPCGDAAIILQDLKDSENKDSDCEPESKKQKLEPPNRTGAKLQAGPLIYEEVQSVGKCRVKPGKGNPTLSMSCSDKIAKWQILGLQGCLLSNFIPEPIRFSSITIGAFVPFSESSLERAIYQRFQDKVDCLKSSDDDIKILLREYCLPSFSQSAVNFSNYFEPSSEIKKNPSPCGIIWNCNSNNLDMVQVVINGRKQGATKKSYGTPTAMVVACRRNIFKLFNDIYLKSNNGDLGQTKCWTYLEAKQMNQFYVKCWSAIKSNVLNGWTDKPDNMQNFNL